MARWLRSSRATPGDAVTLYRSPRALILSALIACGATEPDVAPPDPMARAAACLTQEDGLGELDADGDGELTIEDVEEGQAAMRVAWRDASDVVWTGRYLSETTKVTHGDFEGNQDRWGLWFRTPCEPESAAFVWFRGPANGRLVDGTWEVYQLSWDVPEVENGGRNLGATGEVVLTVHGDTATGHVNDPVGVMPIEDYLLGEQTGERVEIVDLVFRGIPVELD